MEDKGGETGRCGLKPLDAAAGGAWTVSPQTYYHDVAHTVPITVYIVLCLVIDMRIERNVIMVATIHLSSKNRE